MAVGADGSAVGTFMRPVSDLRADGHHYPGARLCQVEARRTVGGITPTDREPMGLVSRRKQPQELVQARELVRGLGMPTRIHMVLPGAELIRHQRAAWTDEDQRAAVASIRRARREFAAR